MALTRSNWTVDTVWRNGHRFVRGTCTVAQTASEKQAFTKAITFLDPSKKFGIFANTRGVSLDGAALPVDVIGTTYTTDDYPSIDVIEESSVAALTHNGLPVSGSSGVVVGGIVKASLIADVKAAQGFVVFDPRNTAAHAELPTIYLNLDGAGALSADTCHWHVIQAID